MTPAAYPANLDNNNKDEDYFTFLQSLPRQNCVSFALSALDCCFHFFVFERGSGGFLVGNVVALFFSVIGASFVQAEVANGPKIDLRRETWEYDFTGRRFL